jgi:hypothetical protein
MSRLLTMIPHVVPACHQLKEQTRVALVSSKYELSCRWMLEVSNADFMTRISSWSWALRRAVLMAIRAFCFDYLDDI